MSVRVLVWYGDDLHVALEVTPLIGNPVYMSRYAREGHIHPLRPGCLFGSIGRVTGLPLIRSKGAEHKDAEGDPPDPSRVVNIPNGILNEAAMILRLNNHYDRNGHPRDFNVIRSSCAETSADILKEGCKGKHIKCSCWVKYNGFWTPKKVYRFAIAIYPAALEQPNQGLQGKVFDEADTE